MADQFEKLGEDESLTRQKARKSQENIEWRCLTVGEHHVLLFDALLSMFRVQYY